MVPDDPRSLAALGMTPILLATPVPRQNLVHDSCRTGILPTLRVIPSEARDLCRAEAVHMGKDNYAVCSGRMLQVVAENLLQNAIRYAGPGSTATLSARPGVLEAADDGRGVDEDELTRLFERFFRSDRARASRGTGLGLAIARRLVQGMGGKIWVESEPGAGCKFSFILPLMPPTSESEGKDNGR